MNSKRFNDTHLERKAESGDSNQFFFFLNGKKCEGGACKSKKNI